MVVRNINFACCHCVYEKKYKKEEYGVVLYKIQINMRTYKLNKLIYTETPESILTHLFMKCYILLWSNNQVILWFNFLIHVLFILGVYFTDRVLLSPMRNMVVPPPMSAYSLQLPCAVNQVIFCCHGNTNDLAVLLENSQIAMYTFNGKCFYWLSILIWGFLLVKPMLCF